MSNIDPFLNPASKKDDQTNNIPENTGDIRDQEKWTPSPHSDINQNIWWSDSVDTKQIWSKTENIDDISTTNTTIENIIWSKENQTDINQTAPITDPIVNNESNINNGNAVTSPATDKVINDTTTQPSIPVDNHADNTANPNTGSTNIGPNNTAKQVQPTIVKQWSKTNTKMILIWCGVFFLLFMMLVGIAFYIAITNPQSLVELGISTENIKSILLVFAIILFGLLFFIWFAFFALNGYRFFTSKTGSKIKYGLGMLLWLMTFAWAIWLGVVSYIKINWISDEKSYNTNDLIIAHLQVKKYDNNTSLPYSRLYIGTPWLKLIWPSYFDLQLNEKVFTNMIAWSNITVNKITIDCGNWQTIVNTPSELSSQLFFNWACLYIDKWSYEIKFTYDYFDNIQRVNQTRTISRAAMINIETDYDFNIDGWSWTLNDNKNEVIIWTAPAKLAFDAQKIFTDLNIPNINIYRDIDWDNQVDKQDRVSFTYYLNEPKLYSSYVSLPALQLQGIWPVYYMMRYRVNAGDVPLCDIVYTKSQQDNIYNVAISINDRWTDISDYSFDIIDNNTDEIINTLKSNRNNQDITFVDGKEYRVRWYFTTTEDKRWACEWDVLDIWASYYNILTDISYVVPWWESYNRFVNSGTYSLSWNNITIWDTPTTIKVSITDILPSIANPQIKLFVDGDLKNPVKTNEYVFSIQEEWTHEILIQVDDNRWRTSSKTYNIDVQKQALIGILKASTYIWFDPMTVEFDASVSKLNDPDDEVVYFTWDFGDGEVRNNTSVWKIIHTYRFDNDTENWEYRPKVTIRTKKWITQEIPLDQNIIVKRAIRSFDIVSLSHPTQIAKVWDIIDFAIQADWQIKSITWDFGDGTTLNWPNREFAEASNIYKQTGTYNIYVTIEYEDSSPVTQNIKVIINNQ